MDPDEGVRREWLWPDDLGVFDPNAVSTPVLGPSNTTGVVDGSDAAAGKIGEFKQTIVPLGSAVALTNNVPKDVATLVLTAGDWDLYGVVVISSISATTVSNSPQKAGVGPTQDTLPTTLDLTAQLPVTLTTSALNITLICPRQRVSLAAGATYHLVASAVFSAGTVTGYGRIEARRVR